MRNFIQLRTKYIMVELHDSIDDHLLFVSYCLPAYIPNTHKHPYIHVNIHTDISNRYP